MKKFFAFILIVIAALTLCLASCTQNPSEQNSLWDSATHKEDVSLGNGSKTVKVEVKAEDKSVTITLNTDKKTLGDALLEHKLVSGEKGAYGLYIKVVNGIEADYSKTNSYWAFCKDGESVLHGVDSEEISNGAHYELVYTKE